MSYLDVLKALTYTDERDRDELLSIAKDWAVQHGVGMRPKINPESTNLTLAPFALLPSPIPKASFEDAISVQTLLNKLLHRLAYDHKFLQGALSKTIENDDFTRRLFEIYTTVREEGCPQLTLAIIRNDLMFFGCNYKQVEVNTIASGFGHLGPATTALHRFVLTQMGFYEHLANLPENNALTNICKGMVQAWNMFNVESSVILFVVEDITYNICDQRSMEFEIRRLANIKVIRRSFAQLAKEAYLGPSMELYVGSNQVALVYFRVGYDPAQYTEEFWSLRLMIEKSTAIKCPSIQFHLIGAKKYGSSAARFSRTNGTLENIIQVCQLARLSLWRLIQQVISEEGILEKYLSDPESVQMIRKMFVDIYPLDQSEDGEKGYMLAMTQPELFVLKPQREGGGNNIYGQDIPKKLAEISREEASSWILMRLIQPQVSHNMLVWPSFYAANEVVSEVGIFGVLIGTEKEILVNEVCGHMMRSKFATAREGGVTAGDGVLDSPYLN